MVTGWLKWQDEEFKEWEDDKKSAVENEKSF